MKSYKLIRDVHRGAAAATAAVAGSDAAAAPERFL